MLHLRKAIFKKLVIWIFFLVSSLLICENIYAQPYGVVLVNALRVRAKADVKSSQVYKLKRSNRFNIKGYDGS